MVSLSSNKQSTFIIVFIKNNKIRFQVQGLHQLLNANAKIMEWFGMEKRKDYYNLNFNNKLLPFESIKTNGWFKLF